MTEKKLDHATELNMIMIDYFERNGISPSSGTAIAVGIAGYLTKFCVGDQDKDTFTDAWKALVDQVPGLLYSGEKFTVNDPGDEHAD